MKKFGLIIFVAAVLVGIVFANLFSFGRVDSKVFDFAFVSSVKGSGVEQSEVRTARDFTSVDVGGVFEVEVIAGNDFGLEVVADDNLLQYIRTEVNNGVLEIGTTRSIKSRNPLRVRVSAPNITNIAASGASKVAVEQVKNSSFGIDTSGASKLRVAGETGTLKIDVSGSSDVDAENLTTRTADIGASGASKVSLFVTERLTSEASGASRVVYGGNPTSVEKRTSGASSVRQR